MIFSHDQACQIISHALLTQLQISLQQFLNLAHTVNDGIFVNEHLIRDRFHTTIIFQITKECLHKICMMSCIIVQKRL